MTKPDALHERIAKNAQASQLASRRLTAIERARSSTEEWLTDLGTKFLDVRMLIPSPGGVQHVIERHVDDCSTLSETVRMAMERHKARYAVYPYMGRWCLVSPWKEPTKMLRYYDTQEAAEMVAILNG